MSKTTARRMPLPGSKTRGPMTDCRKASACVPPHRKGARADADEEYGDRLQMAWIRLMSASDHIMAEMAAKGEQP